LRSRHTGRRHRSWARQDGEGDRRRGLAYWRFRSGAGSDPLPRHPRQRRPPGRRFGRRGRRGPSVTLVEFYDQLAEIALGWLGWTEEQALAADVNAIQVAYEGRLDMFEFVGWIKREAAPKA